MSSNLATGPPEGGEAELPQCPDCQCPFVPQKRWGQYPGYYKRCEPCREGKKLHRRLRNGEEVAPKPPSYIALRDYMYSQLQPASKDIELTDKQLSEGSGLSVRTVQRVIAAMKNDYFLAIEIHRECLSKDFYITRRTLHLSSLPPEKEETA